MNIEDSLELAVKTFHITASNGAQFWAPYLRNDDYTKNPNVPRGLGKSSVEEIKKSADYIVSLFPAATGAEIRQKLVDGSLPKASMNYKGVDCSGFVYYVFNQVYKDVLRKELIDDLSVPKDHVLNGANNFEEWQSAYNLSEEEAKKLPEDVPMRWVVETFKRKPVNLCRVAGLVSSYSSVIVPADSMKVGDLVELSGREGYKEHVALVFKVEASSVSIAHSGRKDRSDTGGVMIENLRYNGAKINTSEMLVPRDFINVRRLKSLILAV